MAGPFLTLRNSEGAGYIASGLARKTMRGDAMTVYRPWRWVGDPLDYPIGVPEVEAATFVRDALGRVSTVIRNNELEGVTYRHALSSEHWDAEDLDSARSHYATPTRTFVDGHGRVEKTQRDAKVAGVADTLITAYGYTATGEMNGIKQSHAAGVETGDYSGRNVARGNWGDYARRIGSESAIRFTPQANRGDYEHRGAPSGGRRWAAQARSRRMLAPTVVPA